MVVGDGWGSVEPPGPIRLYAPGGVLYLYYINISDA